MIRYKDQVAVPRYALGASHKYRFMKGFVLSHLKDVMRRWAFHPEQEGDEKWIADLISADITLYTIYSAMKARGRQVEQSEASELALNRIFDDYVSLLFNDE